MARRIQKFFRPALLAGLMMVSQPVAGLMGQAYHADLSSPDAEGLTIIFKTESLSGASAEALLIAEG